MVLIRKNGLWRVYATRWVGLGLWGRCVSYVRENSVSYARQQIWFHMHAKTAFYMHAKHVRLICTPKSIFAYQYHKFSFLFGVLFIRIFMTNGCIPCDTPYVGSRQRTRFWSKAKNLEHMLTKIFSAFLLKANMSPCRRQLNPNMSKSHISAMLVLVY